MRIVIPIADEDPDAGVDADSDGMRIEYELALRKRHIC